MTAIDDNQRLVAILRGIRTDEVDSLVGALIDSGFTAIEIPLNSPTPFDSITRAADLSRERGGPERLIGAEIATGMAGSDAPLCLVATAGMADRYAAALTTLGIDFDTADAEDAVRNGLFAMAARIWPE